MPTLTNPYTAGDPVGKTAFFVGRADVLREVGRMLRHPTQNAITLYGQRRIGKTSILQYLEAHLPQAGPYLPVYFDLMHKAGLPLGEILRDLARSIALKLNLPDGGLENTTEKTFHDAYLPGVLRALPEQASLVLLLDEFDVLADPQAEQHSKRQFFSYLRDLRQLDPQRLQFIFVLGRNIDDLDVVAQGLFKDLPSQRVSLLGQKDAEALARLSERQGSLAWTPNATARVWELTSGHPYLTQALCSQIWEDAREVANLPAPAQPADVEKAVAGALERSQNMFAWLWEGLGPAEKVVAAALAGVGPTVVDEDRLGTILAESGVRILIGELQNAPKILQKWDILAPAEGGYRFRVELLRRWIAENWPLSRTQDELDRINPVANNLFNAASGYYQGNDLAGAEPLLRQALGLNPNHLRANELLAEILLAKNSLDEAQTLLERLEEIAPGKARRRLKQIYLKRAESASTDTDKLQWYEKILALFPADPQAQEARKQIYLAAGERALQAKDFRAAMTAFQQAGDVKMYNHAATLDIRHEITTQLDQIVLLEAKDDYQEAYKRLRDLAQVYPNARNWQADLDRLKAKTRLDEKYKLALDALQQGDRAQAKKRLAEVIALEPDYEQASRYLHLAVTGDDPQALKKALAAEQAKTAQKVEASNLPLTPHPVAAPPAVPSPTPPKTKPFRKLSPWNPADYLRLLWWIGVSPVSLNEYKKAYGEAAARPLGSRLAYTLTFLPLLTPALAIGLGLWGAGLPDRGTALLLGAGVAGLWLLALLLSDVDEVNEWVFGMAVVVAVVVAVIMAAVVASGSMAFLVAFVVASIVAVIMAAVVASGSMAFLVAFLVACSVAGGIVVGGGGLETAAFIIITVFGVGLLMGENDRVIWWISGLVAGLLGGGGVGWLSGRFIAITWFQSLTSIGSGTVAFFVVLGVVASVMAGVENNVKAGKPSYWLPILLALSWLTLAFLSFGGLAWLQNGVWPLPSWPF